jgi:hypothetical protein
MSTWDGLAVPDNANRERTALCMRDRQRWQRLQGVSLHTPRGVQLSWPLPAAHAQELVGCDLSQNCPPAVLQSESTAHVPASFVMLSMGYPAIELPPARPCAVHKLKLP